MNDFNYIYTVANSLYGLELEPEQFEELGLTAWNLIGNKTVRLYNYSADISYDNLSVQLPCNCDIIEAVTYNHEDWNYSTNKTVNGDYNSQFTEQYIEARKLYQAPLYISGKYAKYERVGDTLYFDKDYGKVNILYKGVILDEDGLPQVNEKEALAIAEGDNLSLAIGKKGQNIKLAARLTHYRIDVKTRKQAEEENPGIASIIS